MRYHVVLSLTVNARLHHRALGSSHIVAFNIDQQRAYLQWNEIWFGGSSLNNMAGVNGPL